MSYQVRIVVVCDEGACTDRLQYTYVNEGGLTAAWALRKASDAGWSVSGATTRCPRHRQPLRTHPFVADRYGLSCGAKLRGHFCFKPAGHPIHAAEEGR